MKNDCIIDINKKTNPKMIAYINFCFIFCIFLPMVIYTKEIEHEHQLSGSSVTLTEIDDVLPNPFKGFATRIGFENPTYDTKLQYSRFTWQELEVGKGVIDWNYFEKDWFNVSSCLAQFKCDN